jgi:methylenetetrahydrofolate dehydrogenase (NADP+)/methenyltetrahydrofolate cyclohydrolase
MGAVLLDGKKIAGAVQEDVKAEVAVLQREGVTPRLQVLLVGSNPASLVYVRNKKKASDQVGIVTEIVNLAEQTGTGEILERVETWNRDPLVHGILVQLPLPPQIDEDKVLLQIDPRKDVDGFHPLNVGALCIGNAGFIPCTPQGIIEILDRSDIEIKGKEAVVIGRSNIVGKPTALLLLHRHATVTICHSRTKDLASVASRADILVAAIGKAGLVTAEFIKPGATVIDVGMNRVDDPAKAAEFFGSDSRRIAEVREKGSTLIGDVHPLEAASRAGFLTPVPGGVGPMTIAMLLKNVVKAAWIATKSG